MLNASRLAGADPWGIAKHPKRSSGNEWKDSAKLLRLKTRIFHFDFSLVTIAKEWRFHDYTRFDDEAMDFAVIPQKRNVLGDQGRDLVLRKYDWNIIGESLQNIYKEIMSGKKN